jgi:hypothetical protein
MGKSTRYRPGRWVGFKTVNLGKLLVQSNQADPYRSKMEKKTMTIKDKTNKRTARAVGVLYIIGTVSGILSLVLSAPVRDAEDLLVNVAANENQIILGALCVLIMGLALAMVPVVAFPVLRNHNEVLAVGYTVFRGGLETVGYIAMAIGWLLLVPLSHAYAHSGALDASHFHALGDMLLEAHEIGSIHTIVFCLGALMFYSVLYRSRLVPRWLSGWGLIAALPFLASALLSIFGLISPLSDIYLLLEMPLALQEMVLAVWLIAKGFSSAAIASGSGRQMLSSEYIRAD